MRVNGDYNRLNPASKHNVGTMLTRVYQDVEHFYFPVDITFSLKFTELDSVLWTFLLISKGELSDLINLPFCTCSLNTSTQMKNRSSIS